MGKAYLATVILDRIHEGTKARRREEKVRLVAHEFLDCSERVIGAALAVHRTLGPGFLEGVYENALAVEFGERALVYERQVRVAVDYRGGIVGVHTLDLIVERSIVVELKAIGIVMEAHLAQLRSYLKATGLHTGLLLNFGGPVLGIRRVVN